jgi:hypothetical protein
MFSQSLRAKEIESLIMEMLYDLSIGLGYQFKPLDSVPKSNPNHTWHISYFPFAKAFCSIELVYGKVPNMVNEAILEFQ